MKEIQQIQQSHFASPFFSHKSLIRLWITSSSPSSNAPAKTIFHRPCEDSDFIKSGAPVTDF